MKRLLYQLGSRDCSCLLVPLPVVTQHAEGVAVLDIHEVGQRSRLRGRLEGLLRSLKPVRAHVHDAALSAICDLAAGYAEERQGILDGLDGASIASALASALVSAVGLQRTRR